MGVLQSGTVQAFCNAFERRHTSCRGALRMPHSRRPRSGRANGGAFLARRRLPMARGLGYTFQGLPLPDGVRLLAARL